MFDQFYKWAKLIAVLCFIPTTFFLCLFLNSLRVASDQLTATAKDLPQQVDTRIGKLQTDVMGKIDTVQDKLTAEVNTLATKVDNRLESVVSVADNRISSLEKNTFTAVDNIRATVDTQLTTTNGSVAKLVTAYADIPTQVGARYERDFSSYFDCAKNKLCLQGQASDTMFAVRTTSRDMSEMTIGIKDTMPKIQNHMLTISDTFARDVPLITGNINGIALNINKLTTPHWYDRVLGYALNGVVMYRSLNPVTSLTVKGAQVISSQK